MKITRKYASRENAVDARMIIQDLILSEFELRASPYQLELASQRKNSEMKNGGIY